MPTTATNGPFQNPSQVAATPRVARPPTGSETAPKSSPDSRGLRWPLLIVGLLSAHVIGMLSAVLLINHRTRSLGVVDDYYGQALNWDQHQALVRSSQQLGWHVQIDPSSRLDPAGLRPLTVTLTDAANRPIPNATLSLTCLHPAHPDRPVEVTFPASPDGRFSRPLPLPYEGFYDFTLTAKSGTQTFVTTLTQWVTADSDPAAHRS